MTEAFGSSKFTLSHVGIFVRDRDKMLEFYVDTLGFFITDQGAAKGAHVTFLSRNPTDHHQVALVTGRQTELDQYMVQQVSFRVDSLEALRDLYPIVKAAPISDMQPVFHGVSYSLYFRDPEGNRLEFFADTPWYVEQPCLQPLDFTKSVDEIYKETKAFAESQPSFRPMEDWQADFDRKLAGV